MASGDLLAFWGAQENEAPISGSGFVSFDRRNGQPVLRFGARAPRTAMFSRILPGGYAGGGLTLQLIWAASVATLGDVVWGGAIERRNADIDVDGFAGQQTATGTANATSGILTTTSITFGAAAMDGLQPNEPFRLQLQRLAGVGADTMLGDAELVSAALIET